jgi:REP element-mobilizing transposase RayT
LKLILLPHIKENAFGKSIYIDTLNCVENHIHLLISLGTEQTIAKTAQLIKGESSNWINKNNLTGKHFEWQDDYIALSVSNSAADKVRSYIKNQEEHHKRMSFAEEYNRFLDLTGLSENIK